MFEMKRVIKKVDIKDLRLDETNPRINSQLKDAGIKLTQENIKKALLEPNSAQRLMKDIGRIGVMERPYVEKVGAHFVVIEGNTRVAACKELGIKTIEVEILEDISDTDRRTFLARQHVRPFKEDWTALPKALEMFKMVRVDGKSSKEVGEELGIPKTEVEYNVRAVELTQQFVSTRGAGDWDSDKLFAYMYRFVRNKMLKKQLAEMYGNLDAGIERFFSWIKAGCFTNKEDVRILSKILNHEDSKNTFLESGSFKVALETLSKGQRTVGVDEIAKQLKKRLREDRQFSKKDFKYIKALKKEIERLVHI